MRHFLLPISLLLVLLSCQSGNEILVDPPRQTTLNFTNLTVYRQINSSSVTIESGLYSDSYINTSDRVIEFGHCWSAINKLPTIKDRHTGQGRTDAVYSTLTNLSPDSTYYVDSYVLTQQGNVFYGRATTKIIVDFTLAKCEEPKAALPVSTSLKVNLPTAVKNSFMGQFMINGQAFFVQNDASFWAYNVQTNSWQSKAPLPDNNRPTNISPFYAYGRYQQLVFSDGQYGYVGFGYRTADGKTQQIGELYQYDVQRDVWKQLNSFTALTEYNFTFIGRDENLLLFCDGSSFWNYSLQTGEWERATPMFNVNQYRLRGSVQSGSLIYLQVYNSTPSGFDLLVYDVNTGLVQTLPSSIECDFERATNYSSNLFFIIAGKLYASADQLVGRSQQMRGIITGTNTLAQFDLNNRTWENTFILSTNTAVPPITSYGHTVLSDQKQAFILDRFSETLWLLKL